MKPLLKVESNRINYHLVKDKNTVHRSSLLVPRFESARTYISLVNHFLLKRNNSDVVLKMTALDSSGDVSDSFSIEVNEPRVYSMNLDEIFEARKGTRQYIVEFYSSKNLYIPFPAVMINHVGSDFINTIHSYNRVLNDVFEDDEINKHHVFESSIDVVIDDEYDTFFNFCTGPFKVADKITLNLIKNIEDIMIETARLTNKNFFLSDFFDGNRVNGEVLKILQPKQPLFYGRLLTGVIDKRTKAFSANHSYYDSSTTHEYFDNNRSYRNYPYFADCQNDITMYPIMSPSVLDVYIEVYQNGQVYKSSAKRLVSPSSISVSFNINEIVKESAFSNVSLFRVVASTNTMKIPTRVNHQLIYSPYQSRSKLKSSINVSLMNAGVFIPPRKAGLTWGQIALKKGYSNRVGVCFKDTTERPEDVSVEFYSTTGLIFSLSRVASPHSSLIFDDRFFREICEADEFIWFVARSARSDLTAQSFHYHLSSGNASGEHSF